MITLSKTTKGILLENATSMREYNAIVGVTESDAVKIDSALISKMYTAALDKTVDFGSIPESKGDITKFEGYTSTMETIKLLEELSKKQRVDIPELEDIRKAITHVEAERQLYMKGYAANRGIVIMTYNSIVMAILDALSHTLSSYVEFVRTPSSTEFKLVKSTNNRYTASFDAIRAYNKAAESGDVRKVLSEGVKGRQQFVGDTLIVTAIAIGSISMIVPLIREIVYYFYYNRLVVGDYLEHQAALLEFNRTQLEKNKNLTTKERKKIDKKQQEYIKELNKLSEMITVEAPVSEKQANKLIKDENKSWTISELESEANMMDPSGFSLI